MLNVDNEVVKMNSTHVYFSGLGRQKPKRYIMDLSLYGEIDHINSDWWFGSVGTIRFKLQKAKRLHWPRLLKDAGNVKNHRIWWEQEERLQDEERKMKLQEVKAARAREEEHSGLCLREPGRFSSPGIADEDV